MITKWKVYNFKSVREETELDLAPLTIFAGANSSGKSTLLQSILLVAQTLSHKVSSHSVVLNGALTKLGQFDDLCSSDSEADQIVVGWSCEPIRQTRGHLVTDFRKMSPYFTRRGSLISSLSCEIAFDTETSGPQKEITQIQPRLFSSQMSVLTRDSKGGDRHFFLNIHRTSDSDERRRRWIDAIDNEDSPSRASLQYSVELDENSMEDIRDDLTSAVPVGCLLRHFLPERLSLGVDMTMEASRSILNVLTGDSPRFLTGRFYQEREITVPTNVVDYILELAGQISEETSHILTNLLEQQQDLFGPTELLLEDLYDALRKLKPVIRNEIRQKMSESKELEDLVLQSKKQEGENKIAVVPFRAPAPIVQACWYLDEFFSGGVRYLGPLRDEPKSLYPLAPTADPSDVGLKGEHTAAVLELHKSKRVRYIPSKAFAEAEIKAEPILRSLEAAVIDWLQYLGVAVTVQSRDRGKLGHELKVGVKGDRGSHDLTHVGVGVSQVLPILVASLIAEPDTTLIFEQPELHLHPKVQTLLADFFLSMTQLGKQCIVETHSEYLINRLRFRTAAAMTSNPWVSATKVYFVERKSGGSTFREVEINEYGAVLDWPKGFFDQSQHEAEAILKAAMLKKKRQSKESGSKREQR